MSRVPQIYDWLGSSLERGIIIGGHGSRAERESVGRARKACSAAAVLMVCVWAEGVALGAAPGPATG